jgi:hypothetical protein
MYERITSEIKERNGALRSNSNDEAAKPDTDGEATTDKAVTDTDGEDKAAHDADGAE